MLNALGMLERSMIRPRLLMFTVASVLSACGGLHVTGGESGSESGSEGEDETGETGETGGEEDERILVNHDFGDLTLAPFEEDNGCIQWTVANEQPVYVQSVTLSNYGYFHHSNWFVVPETLYEGPDGYFECGSRGFDEIEAAVSGTVLFAQSTQSFVEEQRTGDGAVIKIPPHHKVVGGIHMLNVGPAEVSTQLFMSLEIIHPAEVDLVLTPFRLSYLDLDIPAQSESHFTGVVDDFAQKYEDATNGPLDIKLHYALAHYHYLGNYFDLSFDGESVYELQGFNGEANGLVFDPPLDLAGVQEMTYTCGYDNWRDVNVGWGIGDQEMCVMLGLAESKVLFDATVTGLTQAVGETPEGVIQFEGPSAMFVLPKNPAQTMPSTSEIEGELYIPPSGDDTVPPIPACTDHDPSVPPVLEPTLTNAAAVVFQQSCTFNACHGDSAQAAGLNLQAPDLHAELLGHQVLGNAGATLVEPGDPASSWLYEIIASCTPEGGSGNHMPLNAPVLLDDRSIALVREWIAAGAAND